MELNLRGSVALITGASQGIGAATAEAFAREGAHLVLSARQAEQLMSLAGRLKQAYGVETLVVPADLRSEAAVKHVVMAAYAQFGRIDVLFNNAGANRRGGPLELDDAAWQADQELRPLGYVRFCREVLPSMIAARRGVIVNNLGYAGRTVLEDYVAGSSAVGGLINFTKMLAEQVARHGVRVVGVHPGPIDTPRLAHWTEDELRRIVSTIPLGRLGRPEEVADLVVFLASERAAFITGACFLIDGGASRGIG
ncbi:MAG: short-chain dehydrogenase [Dehalococcoidia bacterium]|nr:MAG: short-chain dehydrogenase [Dehalococcoidia bacterium]